jgi:tRNA dimethylallyltransferase
MMASSGPEQQQKSSSTVSPSLNRGLVVVLAGPTASGKGDVAARLCRSRRGNSVRSGDGKQHYGGGIIVSADSVQAYRGVQIGANKPSRDERTETPHILIDVADCKENYNAADWCKDALMTIEALLDPKYKSGQISRSTKAEKSTGEQDDDEAIIQDRQEVILESIRRARIDKGYNDEQSLMPVVCGGTMMYLTWLVHGRPDAMRPSDSAVQTAKETIESFQADDDDVHTSKYEAAVKHVASFGSVFADRTQQFCGEDWYRLRRTLEIALTVQEQRQDQQQQNTIDSTEDEKNDPCAERDNDAATTTDIAQKLFTGEREGSLSSLGYDVRCFFLCPDDRMQHARIIDERCEQMIIKGLLKETADLYLNGELPEMVERAIGYRQTLDYLLHDYKTSAADENGGVVQKETERILFESYLNEFTTATRRYAKKQMSWFRKDKEFIFVPVLLECEKSDRADYAANIIERLCNLSREEYESELFGNTSSDDNNSDIDKEETMSLQLKKKNESQAKGMKFYQFERHILKPDSDIFNDVLADAIELRQRVGRQKKKLR